MHANAIAGRGRGRRGSMALELLFVLPVLLAVLLGTVEFALWLSGQQQVTLASREGARAAATGAGEEEVAAAVRGVLGEVRFEIAQLRVEILDAAGDPIAPGDPVAVAVALPAGAVVPDLLRFAGLSIRNQFIVSRTVMRKE